MHPFCVKPLLGLCLWVISLIGTGACDLLAWASYGALFFLYFPSGISVHWCLRRLTWVQLVGHLLLALYGHTVALELSSFLASCLTLLAGSFSRSTLLSLMVLETKSSYLRKNQKMSLCKI